MANSDNTKISIINMALKSIKQQTISSPSDNNERARVANLYYDKARRAALRACDWHWATIMGFQMNLLGSYDNAIANPTVASAQDYVPGWNFLYAEPPSAIRVQKVYNNILPAVVPFSFAILPFDDDDFFYNDPYGRQNDFRICRSPVTNVNAIAMQLPNAVCDFTQDIKDESQFDDAFVEGFVFMLAYKMCLPLTADKELAQLVKADGTEYFGEAKRKNGGESTERGPRYSDYEKTRN